MTKNFPQVHVRQKTQTQEGNPEHNQDKYKNTTLMHLIFKLQKIKNKEKILKEARDWVNGLPKEKQNKNNI